MGSVPFEQRSEIVVGGSFPLQLFKNSHTKMGEIT
ncbi:hypothetical protein CCAN12_470009 [Capnocytophaga canimorsus]|uniref:Uncharacterized protein n=1 Tax=Capnocytophaga canimorsus TaxID=28188 RepID=A0A0B7H2J7_9FLAO|nr:hypothetical protein CCAN12_470009 [Capnocytophaga canimorsus]